MSIVWWSNLDVGKPEGRKLKLLRLCLRNDCATVPSIRRGLRNHCSAAPSVRLCLSLLWDFCTASNCASCSFTGAVRRLCKSSFYIYIYLYIYIYIYILLSLVQRGMFMRRVIPSSVRLPPSFHISLPWPQHPWSHAGSVPRLCHILARLRDKRRLRGFLSLFSPVPFDSMIDWMYGV